MDAGVERPVNEPDPVVGIEIACGAEHHRPHAVGRNLDPGPAKRRILQGFLLSRVATATGSTCVDIIAVAKAAEAR